MTTICLCQTEGSTKVWRKYECGDNRSVFDVRVFDRLEDAEAWVKRIMSYREADHFERITGN
jgi:hypothetical protein